MDFATFVQKLEQLIVHIYDYPKYLRWFVSKCKIIINGKDDTFFYQGDVVKINFGYNIGSEINKERYAVIVSPSFLKHGKTITVCPLSSIKTSKQLLPDIHYPLTNSCDFLEKDSVVLINNIKDLSKKRIIKKVGSLQIAERHAIASLIANLYGPSFVSQKNKNSSQGGVDTTESTRDKCE